MSMKSKIYILIDEGDLLHSPSAIVEVHSPVLSGGVRARNGWHVPPTLKISAFADYDMTVYGKTIEILKKKIDSLFPETRYDREYL